MHTPSFEEIRSELDYIFASRYFRHSVLLQKFLRFVVEKTLEGKGNEIKEYTVGVEVLDRPMGFNPQQDASVRIHAVRLRRNLKAWYQDEGSGAPIRIVLEKGSYQPVFLYRDNLPPEEKPGVYIPRDTICILPFECYVTPQENEASIRDGFCAELTESLSHFQDITTVSWLLTSNYLANGGDIDQIGKHFKASYQISGRIQISETDITVTVYLNEPADPMPIWSQIFTQSIENQSVLEIIKEISEKIISMLVDYNGYIHVHRYGARDFATLPSNKTSLAIFWFYHFVTRNTAEIYFEALKHLEIAVKEDPGSTMAWAILGQLQFNGIIYGYVNDPAQLELSKQSIERALLLDPDSQHGLMCLSVLKIINGQTEEAKALLDKCINLNPNSGYFQATVSLGYTMVGEYQKAIDLLKKAYTSNPVPIWWLSIPEFINALISGDYKGAIHLAPRFHPAAGILQNVFEIIALYHLGDMKKFEALVKDYNEKYPDGIRHVSYILLVLFHDKKGHKLFSEALDAAALLISES